MLRKMTRGAGSCLATTMPDELQRDVVITGSTEIFLEIATDPAFGPSAVVEEQVIGPGHCTIIRNGVSAALGDDDVVTVPRHLIWRRIQTGSFQSPSAMLTHISVADRAMSLPISKASPIIKDASLFFMPPLAAVSQS